MRTCCKTSCKARVKATTKRVTKMRPRSPRPVTTQRDPVETRRRDGRTDASWGLFHQQHGDGNQGTGRDADHQARELSQSRKTEKHRDKDEVKKAKIERARQHYNAKHFIEESCSQSRSVQEPMQLSSRCKQMVWPSGGSNYRELDSRKAAIENKAAEVESRI